MSGTPADAHFRFESAALSIEFAGPEDWVAAQIAFFTERMRQAMGEAEAQQQRETARTVEDDGGATSEPDPAGDAPPPAAPPLAEFYARARSREGRGALQEKILIFAYYLRTHGGRDEVTIDELRACFELVGTDAPRSLANTLGIMKRTQGFFEPGSGRGRYALSDKGLRYVRGLAGAQ